MPPAFSASRAGVTPEASRDRSSGTFAEYMILAYALPPLWMMVSAAYLLIAVPTVFISSVLTLAFDHKSLARRRSGIAIKFTLLGFSILNLALTFYFFFSGRQPGENLAFFDLAWTVSVICAPIMLMLSAMRYLTALRRERIHS